MQALRSLPKATVEAKAVRTASGVEVTLRNPSKSLAFQVAVAAQKDGEDLVPVLWSDNYVELMPGESEVLKAALPVASGEHATIVVSGWNVPKIVLPLE